MRVLFFIDYYGYGGIEKVINDITLLNNYSFSILSMVNASNRNINCLLKKKYNNFFIRNLFGLRKYKCFLKKNKYDIMHINCYNAFGLIYGYIARKYVKKIIIHAHNSNIDSNLLGIKRFINYLIKKIFKNNNYTLIACSRDAGKFCFNNNYQVIYNGVDYNRYYYDEKARIEYRKKFLVDNKIVLGNIGRFTKQKNQLFLINIFNELIKDNDNYFLVLIGNGKLKKKIINKINKFSLCDKVLILDNRDDLNKLINMFDYYLAPSLYEGYGLTIVENQINGKKVIVSNNCINDIKISNKLTFLPLEEKYWIKEIKKNKNKNLTLDDKLDISYFIKNIDKIYRS